MAKPKLKIKTILKLATPMRTTDWYGWAGATRGSKIHYGRDFTYFLEPTGKIVASKHGKHYEPIQYEYIGGRWVRTI